MSRQLSELETVLRQLLLEHRKLLDYVERHEAALKAFDLPRMDDAARQQEAVRARLAVLEQRRRTMSAQLAQSLNVSGDLTIRRLAELHPARSAALLQLRSELKATIDRIAARAKVSGKLAAAVLGHLNTVVRLIAGAFQNAGLYTKQGVPRVSARIGVVEAVG